MRINRDRNGLYACIAVIMMAWLTGMSNPVAAQIDNATGKLEPNVEIARAWWPELINVWTQIGWCDHLFRFNVVFDGSLVAQPHVPLMDKPHTMPWQDQGMILTFKPCKPGTDPSPAPQEPYLLACQIEHGIGNQRWANEIAPVLQTRWPMSNNGLLAQKEVFVHLPGGEIKTGTEPLYAWVRLTIPRLDPLGHKPWLEMYVGIRGLFLKRQMFDYDNLMTAPQRIPFPKALRAKICDEGDGQVCYVYDPDGKVRLMAKAPNKNILGFTQRPEGSKEYFLTARMLADPMTYVDLLVPILPVDKADIMAEMALGRDQALRQTNAFWAKRLHANSAALIDTPEPHVNQAITRSLQLGLINTEHNPQNGDYAMISGSWQYDAMWPTLTLLNMHLVLCYRSSDELRLRIPARNRSTDPQFTSNGALVYGPLNMPEVNEKYLKVFRDHQGTAKPPGAGYEQHPGYFSAPRTLSEHDWLTDHGAILHTVCKHALTTNDQDFIADWLDAILAGCEYLRDARARRDHNGVAGVMPPGVATDAEIPVQSVWVSGWSYKGLSTAVRLLQRINHPRADEFAREAADTKKVFMAALREKVKQMPYWKDPHGDQHQLVPTDLNSTEGYLDDIYLDTGPLCLVFCGLLEADDPLMRSILNYFREGPAVALYSVYDNFRQHPVLHHEISSCEPGYSWNVYHNWQIGDRYRYFEGMYSLLMGSMSRQTFVSCETRNGIYGLVFNSPMFIDLLRLAIVDDLIEPDALHLLRMVPKGWLRTDYLSRFERIATEYGTVSVCFKLIDGGKTLKIDYASDFHHAPGKILLHIPPVKRILKVVVNEKAYPASAAVIKLAHE